MFSILHINNSHVFRKIFEEICARNNINYIEAQNSIEVFDILNETKINIIFSSLELKHESGEKIVEDIFESKFKNIPIIIITSFESLEIRNKYFKLGVIDFLSKDTSYDKLSNYIERLTKNENNYDKEIIDEIRGLQFAVIDDSSIERNILKKIFEIYRITNVDFYNNAVDLLNSGKTYSIYLTDIVMPKISGEELISKIREKNRKSVIIALSTNDHYRSITNVLQIGANDYIVKPYNVELFMGRLKANARNYLLLKEIEEKNEILTTLNEKMNMEIKLAEVLHKNMVNFNIDGNEMYNIKTINFSEIGFGGDLIEEVVLDDGRKGVVFLDISGHGVSAALVISAVKFIINAFFKSCKLPSQALYKLNEEINNNFDDITISCTYFIINNENEIILSAASQEDIFIVNKRNVTKFEKKGIILGVVDNDMLVLNDNISYKDEIIKFDKDTKLFLLTDGLVESGVIEREDLEDLLFRFKEKDIFEIDRYLNENIISKIKENVTDDTTYLIMQKK